MKVCINNETTGKGSFMKQIAERGDKEILSPILLQIFFVINFYKECKKFLQGAFL